MNTLNQNSLSEQSENTIQLLKKVAFDWQKKFPLYMENGTLSTKQPSLDLTVYLETIRESIPTTPLLSNDLLLERISALSNNAKFGKTVMPAGYRICLAVMPFNFNGNEFTDEEVKKGLHLHEMIVDQNDVAYLSLSPRGSAMFQVLPKEIQNAAFLSDGIPENIIDQYKKAYANLQAQLVN